MLTASWKFVPAISVLALLTAAAVAFGEDDQKRELSGSAANSPASSQPNVSSLPATSGAATAKTTERLREGTKLIDVVGTFQSVGGDSVTFTPGAPGSNRESLRVLENLSLQRVGQVLEENKGARQWTVSGIITEYKGANYLLLTKAVQPQEGNAAAGR